MTTGHFFRKNIIFFALGVLVLGLGGYKIYIWANSEVTDNAYVEAKISLISSEVNGVIKEVLCDDNQAVKADDIVAYIDNVTYKAELEKAILALKNNHYQQDITDEKLAIEKINLKKAEETLKLSKINFELADRDYKRNFELNKDNFSSKKVLDTSKANFERIKSELLQAEMEVALLNREIKSLDLQQLENIATQDSLMQSKILAEYNLNHTVIRAGTTGILTNNGMRVGNYARAGTPLFSVVPNELYIKANFKETQIVNLTVGKQVSIIFDALKDYQFTGTIRSIAPATGAKFSMIPPDNATGNFTKIVQRIPVIIDIDPNQPGKELIRTGMSAIITARLTKW